MAWLIIAVVLSVLVGVVNGHGYLSQPVSRAYYENLQNRFWNRKCCMPDLAGWNPRHSG